MTENSPPSLFERFCAKKSERALTRRRKQGQRRRWKILAVHNHRQYDCTNHKLQVPPFPVLRYASYLAPEVSSEDAVDRGCFRQPVGMGRLHSTAREETARHLVYEVPQKLVGVLLFTN